MKNICCTIMFVCCAGCCLLPSGDPPPGNIVNNTQMTGRKFTKPSEAFDYMVSSMTAILLEKCPGEEVNIYVNDDKCRTLMSAVFRESSKISGNRAAMDERNWELKSTLHGENFHLSLYYKGVQVWEEVIYSPF